MAAIISCVTISKNVSSPLCWRCRAPSAWGSPLLPRRWSPSRPTEAWQRLSAGEGSQGPRWYDWVWIPMSWRFHPEGMAHWLLARRSLTKPDEIAYYFVFGPAESTLEQVVRVAGTRWQVEQAFELAKGEVGLDEYEVRTWTGWYRHITLAMFALAYLTVVRRHAAADPEKGEPRTGREQHRERGSRTAPPHGARSAPTALRAAVAAATCPRAHSALVRLASTPSGPRQTGSHQTPSAESVTATVVLERVW